jgi:hypothetical protein
MLLICLLVTLWALVATAMVIRNPFPFPDRGHRLFGVSDEQARKAVLEVLKDSGLAGRFRFRLGPSDQTVFWDNTTVVHVLNHASGLTGNGISLAVQHPERAAQHAIDLLTAAGYRAERLPPDSVSGMPPKYLVVISCNAFNGWALAFRHHQLRMPKPVFISVE